MDAFHVFMDSPNKAATSKVNCFLGGHLLSAFLKNMS